MSGNNFNKNKSISIKNLYDNILKGEFKTFN